MFVDKDGNDFALDWEETESSGLTFDWDGVGLDDGMVRAELEYLCEEFGSEFVWYRESSSKTGLHILIGELKLDDLGDFDIIPRPMTTTKQLQYREQSKLECKGRFFSDIIRKDAGLRTSRIFRVKNGKEVGPWKRFK